MSTDLVALAKERNKQRRLVNEWMNSEAANDFYRTNSQAPNWTAYYEAEAILETALYAVGE